MSESKENVSLEGLKESIEVLVKASAEPIEVITTIVNEYYSALEKLEDLIVNIQNGDKMSGKKLHDLQEFIETSKETFNTTLKDYLKPLT